MAALEWGIPLDKWYKQPRAVRASQIGALRTKALINYYAIHQEED